MFKKTLNLCAALALAASSASAYAQLNLEKLVGGVADAVVGGVVETLSGVGDSKSTITNPPKGWDSTYVWRAYDHEHVIPSSSDKVKYYRMVRFGSGVEFQSLPFQHSFTRVRGDGSRKMAILADPTCPYSRQLERDINTLENVTIYTLVAPTLRNKRGAELTRQVMCQPTNQARAIAWENWILNGIEPPKVANCNEPSAKVIQAFSGLVSANDTYFAESSPSVFFENNNLSIPGAPTRSHIEQGLEINSLNDLVL